MRKAVVFLLCLGGTAGAVPSSFDIENAQNLTNGLTEDLIEHVSLGADHRAYMPATPLPTVIGIDVGIQATFFSLPRELRDGINSIAQDKGIPGVVPVPRLIAHKGLPFGLEAGVSFVGFKGNFMLGIEGKWAFIQTGTRKRVAFDPGPPAVALRGSMNTNKLWFIKTTTWTFDLLVSKQLFIVDPYFGIGIQRGSGELEITDVGTLPPGVKTDASFTQPRIFFGSPINLLLVTLTPEVSYSFADLTTYGLKVSLTL